MTSLFSGLMLWRTDIRPGKIEKAQLFGLRLFRFYLYPE